MKTKLQEYITYLLGAGKQVIVMEEEGLFKDSFTLPIAAFIAFDSEATIYINPFSVIDEEKFNLDAEYKSTVILSITLILLLMCQLQGAATDAEEAFIEEAVEHVWKQYSKTATITNVADFLLSHEDHSAKDLGLKLEPFTKDGAYSRFFEGEANLDLEAPYCVLEFSKLKADPYLQCVVFASVEFLVAEKMLNKGDGSLALFLAGEEGFLSCTKYGEWIEDTVPQESIVGVPVYNIKAHKLITHLLNANEQVIILDAGVSFRDSCQLLGGIRIELTSKSGICLNPFSIINEEEFEHNEHYRKEFTWFISIILERMCGLRDFGVETVLIREAIEDVWEEYKGEATITKLAAILLRHKDNKAKALGNILAPFTEGGAYSRIFEGKMNLNLDAPYYVFEFAGLEDNPDLHDILFALVRLLVTESIVHGGNSETTVFISEGDRVLIDQYPTIAKYGCLKERPESLFRYSEGGK